MIIFMAMCLRNVFQKVQALKWEFKKRLVYEKKKSHIKAVEMQAVFTDYYDVGGLKII